jgi:hypothetical protein
MTTQSVFDETQTTTDPVVDTNTTLGQTVYIGDGKKYKTVEEADKAFGFLNAHVEKIQQENKALREQVAKGKTVEEVLETIKQQSSRTDYGMDNQTGSNVQAKEIDLNAVIEDKLSSWEQQRKAQQNLQDVKAGLVERFGDKAAEIFKAKSKELGVDLDQLALISPKAVLEYFPKHSSQKEELVGTINTSYNDNNNRLKIGTKSYWDQQYKEGKITREEKFRREHESATKMGWEAFNK